MADGTGQFVVAEGHPLTLEHDGEGNASLVAAVEGSVRVVDPDPLPQPSGGVGVKLASLARHAEEHCSATGHPLDWAAVKSLVNDPEVLEYMQRLEAAALLPVAR